MKPKQSDQPLKEDTGAPQAWEKHPWAQAAPLPASRPRPASRGQAWSRLPAANQLLFAGGFGCLGLGALILLGPLLAEGAQEAIFPYTGAGKRQTCLANLATLSQALALYAQDSDGHLPFVEEKTPSSTARVTWVSRLRPYAVRESSSASLWSCPQAGATAADASCSYGLNPVLAGEHSPQGEEATTTLLLGDRGTRHDLSLLPPVPGWNTPVTSSAPDTGATNLDFRHDGEAGVVFADGHAATLSPSNTSALALWGGKAVVGAGLRCIEARDAASEALIGKLREGDVTGAARLLKGQKELAKTTGDLQALWTLNWQKGQSSGSSTTLASSDVEEVGWHLARAQEQNGSNVMRAALDAETKRRSEEEHKRVEAAGWDTQTTSSGVKVEVPRGWTWSEENKDRYHTASARSPLPGLWMSLEKGDRTTFSTPIPVDWRTSEKRLQAKYGSGYKRLRMQGATLLGHPAGLWEYELEKPGSPRLRKRYIGTADGWNSYVLSLTGPANDFEAWKGEFERITSSLALG